MKKNSILFAFLLLIAEAGISQNWSEPQPFITNQSNKANAYLGYQDNGGFMLLWEQCTDTLSTAIYYKYFLNGGQEELLLSEPGVHFKHPTIFNVHWAADTTSTIVYEKVHDGKTELCFMKVAHDGGFADPIVVAGAGQTNNHFAREGMNNYFAWNADDHLLVSKVNNNGTMGETDTVFSGPVHQTMFKEQNLYWLTSDADSAYLMQSKWLSAGNWDEPAIIFSAKEINRMAGAIDGRVDGVIGFSYTNDSVWHINNYSNGYGNPWFYPLEINYQQPFDFGLFSTDYGVKNDLEQYYLAWVKDTLGSQEIYANDLMAPEDFYQLSFLNTETRNPQIFQGELTGQWGVNLYLIFEAKVDGYWQLYHSIKFISWGSIDEHSELDGVTISPNPATDHLKISNEHASELSVEIFDIGGKRIYQDFFHDNDHEIKTGNWHRGMYVVKITDGKSQFTRKVILN